MTRLICRVMWSLPCTLFDWFATGKFYRLKCGVGFFRESFRRERVSMLKKQTLSWEIETGVARLGGLSEAEHLVCRTAESRRSGRAQPIWVDERFVKPGGGNVLKITSSCSAAITTSSGPHRALQFGRELRPPAMQAGLTYRALTLREVFSSRMVFLALKNVLFAACYSTRAVTFAARRVAPAA
jgi:hypothetical protein